MKQRFRGSFDVKIDERGRIKVPAKFLAVFDDTFGREVFLTSLNGDSVILYPMRIWEGIELTVENLGVWDPDVDDYFSRLSYWGVESDIDMRGRILIPPALRQECQLSEVIRIMGKANHLVVWNEEIFRAKELGERFSKEKLHRVSRLLNADSPPSGDE
jgi:division/cell wall cluster transcriptional repressor MraZ